MGIDFGQVRDEFLQNLTGTLVGRTYLRDYTHAQKNFLPGGMANAGASVGGTQNWTAG